MRNRKILIVFVSGFLVGIFFAAFIARPVVHGVRSVKSRVQNKFVDIFSHKGSTSTAVVLTPGQGMLNDFDGNGKVTWTGVPNNIVQEKACASGSCLKAVYPKGDFPGLSAQGLPSDWSGFDSLVVDVDNPNGKTVRMGILIKDKTGGHSYPNRYDGEFDFPAGKSTFVFDLTDLKTNDKTRNIDFGKIMELIIFASKPEKATTMYFDNMRLEKRGKDTNPFSQQDGILSDFDGNGPVRWGGVKTKIVEDPNACSKGACLKVSYPKGEFPGLVSKLLPQDWSGFDTLSFDVYNPTGDVVKCGILIKDKPGGHSYPNRYDGEFAFKPGKSTFVFNITGLKTNDKKRNMDTSQIIELIIFLFKPQQDTTIYFDNMRLEKFVKHDTEGLMSFDYGTEDSEVWPGFIKITNKSKYTSEAGYGFADVWNFRSEDRRYPDALFRDWIVAQSPFLIDVPNGDYVVYMMLEDPGFWEYYQNYENRTIYAEGRPVAEEILPYDKFFKEYYYAHLDHEDLPGEDVFKNYVQKRFVWRRFVTHVEDAQLSLSCQPQYAYACTMSALLVAPLDKDKETQEFMRKLDDKRRENFDSIYVEKKRERKPLAPALKSSYEDSGFIPFVPADLASLYNTDIPDKDSVQRDVNLSAAQGERESFVLGLHELRKLNKPVRVQVSDLVNADGKIIPSGAVSVRYVQYKLKIVSPPGIYEVRGELLRESPRVDIDNVGTRYFWFTLNLSADVYPGIYKGDIKIYLGDTVAESLDLNLEVYPFSLAEVNIPVGLFYSLPFQYDWYSAFKDAKWDEIKRQFKDIKNHNMNSIALGFHPDVASVYKTGDAVVNFEAFDRLLEIYNFMRFDKPISGYGMTGVISQVKENTQGDETLFAQGLRSAYQQVEEHTKRLTGQDILIGLADEASNVGLGGIEPIIRYAKILQGSGLRTTAYLNSELDVKIFPFLTDVTINNGMHISQQLLNTAKKAGTQVWFYNIGQNRFTFGYYLWRTGAKGRYQWHYQLPAVDPFFDLDGRESDYCASYPSPYGPINATWFELAAEGVEDYRYLLTLDKLIKEMKQTDETEVKDLVMQAENYLSTLRSSIDVELEKNEWEYSKFGKVRQEIAGYILKLQEKRR